MAHHRHTGFPYFFPTSILLSPVHPTPHALALNKGITDKISRPRGRGLKLAEDPPREGGPKATKYWEK